MTARSLLYEKLNGVWLLKIIFKVLSFSQKYLEVHFVTGFTF